MKREVVSGWGHTEWRTLIPHVFYTLWGVNQQNPFDLGIGKYFFCDMFGNTNKTPQCWWLFHRSFLYQHVWDLSRTLPHYSASYSSHMKTSSPQCPTDVLTAVVWSCSNCKTADQIADQNLKLANWTLGSFRKLMRPQTARQTTNVLTEIWPDS